MKKLILSFTLALAMLNSIAQQSVLISPNGPEAIKFNNTTTEKLTFWDNGVNSKYGIGISSAQFRQYVPVVTDAFLFGVGSNTTFAEKFRINGNGTLETKNRIFLADAGGGESAGLWFRNNGNTALNTFVGIDPSNKFGIYSNTLLKNVFTADMTNGGIRLEGPSVSSPTVNMLSMGGFGKVSIDAAGIIGGRMTILENGNTGVGSNNPSQKLSVQGTIGVDHGNLHDGTFNNLLAFGSSGTGEGIGSKRTAGGNQYGLDFYTAGLSRISIKNSGLVGIGTTNPANQLVLFEPTFGGAMSFQSTASGNLDTDGLYIGQVPGNHGAIFNYENSDLLFGTNSGYKMKLNTAGNLELLGNNKIVNEAFQSLTLQNSWVQNGSFGVPSFYKDKEGRVHLKGGITGGLTGTNTIIATLPTGYRPLSTEFLVFSVYSQLGTNASIIIDGSTGQIRVYTGTMDNTLVTLNGISFRAD